jgi:hypothetical protein
LLNSQDWEPILDDSVKIRNQSALEEAEKPESEVRERFVTVPKLNAWRGLPETLKYDYFFLCPYSLIAILPVVTLLL